MRSPRDGSPPPTRRRWHGGALAVLIAAIAPPLAAPAPATAATVDQVVANGEGYYQRGQFESARAQYLEALRMEPRHFDALCRLVRIESEMSERAKGGERKRLTASALKRSDQLVRLYPDSAYAHVWRAVALGRDAQDHGVIAQIGAARRIRTELDLAIRLNPRNDRAWHARGLLMRRVASMNAAERMAASAFLTQLPLESWWSRSVRDLRRAAELEPYYVKHHLELGRTYYMMRRYAEARAELQKTLDLEPKSSARDSGYQEEARELLAKMARRG